MAATAQAPSATNQFVRIYNYGDTDFVGKFAGDQFIIPPGEERPVPWLAMRLWMGDPASHNNNPRYRHRVAEYKRIRCRYGAYEHDDLWEKNKPRLKAYTWEGEQIVTVVDDPEGDTVTPADVTQSENEMLRNRQQELEAELAALKRHVLGPDGEPVEAQVEGNTVPSQPPSQQPPGVPPLPTQPQGSGGAPPGTPQSIPHPTEDGPPHQQAPGPIVPQPPDNEPPPLKTVPTGPDGGPLLDDEGQLVDEPESHEDSPTRPPVGERGRRARLLRSKDDEDKRGND